MTRSVPGVLISRDGSLREYVGHSNRNGTLFGRVEKLSSTNWRVTCAGCGSVCGANMRNGGVTWLRDHWRNADASMAATHMWVGHF